MLNIKLDSMPKLNIGFFTDSYKPYVSGVVRSIETFRHDLERLGHRVYIFAPDYPGTVQEENVFRFLSLPAPTQPDFFFPIPLSLRLSFKVNNLPLDIIHVHTPFLLGTLGSAMARRFNLPLFFTYHTLYQNYTHYIPMSQTISNQLVKRWNKNFCNRCDMIVAPSLFVKDLIEEGEVKKPVVVIPTGLNLDEYSNNDRSWLKNKYGIKSGEKVLLHVGRLAREKNVEFVIEAVQKLLQKTTTPFKLVIVGSGPAENALKSLCRQYSIDEHVIFTGRVINDELLNCFAGGDIFVFASGTETQGIVLVEAKASGIPVVALNAPCMNGILTDGLDGFLVDDQERFVDRVQYLLENDDIAREMGNNGKNNTASFSAPYLAEKLARNYYSSLLQKRDNPPRGNARKGRFGQKVK